MEEEDGGQQYRPVSPFIDWGQRRSHAAFETNPLRRHRLLHLLTLSRLKSRGACVRGEMTKFDGQELNYTGRSLEQEEIMIMLFAKRRSRHFVVTCVVKRRSLK